MSCTPCPVCPAPLPALPCVTLPNSSGACALSAFQSAAPSLSISPASSGRQPRQFQVAHVARCALVEGRLAAVFSKLLVSVSRFALSVLPASACSGEFRDLLGELLAIRLLIVKRRLEAGRALLAACVCLHPAPPARCSMWASRLFPVRLCPRRPALRPVALPLRRLPGFVNSPPCKRLACAALTLAVECDIPCHFHRATRKWPCPCVRLTCDGKYGGWCSLPSLSISM